eukprot:1526952-Pyramimonas_sp.AAC.2
MNPVSDCHFLFSNCGTGYPPGLRVPCVPRHSRKDRSKRYFECSKRILVLAISYRAISYHAIVADTNPHVQNSRTMAGGWKRSMTRDALSCGE